MGVKDLEVMMQNVISSAFETVTTVELGVQVLDVFQHLSTREVLRYNSVIFSTQEFTNDLKLLNFS